MPFESIFGHIKKRATLKYEKNKYTFLTNCIRRISSIMLPNKVFQNETT